MKNLKILSVSVGKLTDSAETIRILSLADGLRNMGNHVRMITFSKETLLSSDYKLKQLTLKIVPLFNPFTFTKNSLKMLYEYDPDIIIAHTHVPAFIIYIVKKMKIETIPIVYDMHGSIVDEIKMASENNSFPYLYSRILFHFILEKTALYSSTKVLCVSRSAMYHLYQKTGLSLDKMLYVPNGVDLSFFKPLKDNERIFQLRRKFGLENKFVYGYIGGFQKWQGVDNFIKAAFLTHDEKIGFLIVGDGDSWIKGNVVKLRRMPREEVPYYYSLCDVLVLPRPNHPATEVAAPTKFAEYTAMGKPVLVTNVGDAAKLTKKYRCGILLPDNGPYTLRKGFYDFIRLSEHELRKMGENSRKLAEEEFDWSKIIANLNSELINLKES
jgi:glycosyltransferase involved in cell wall biosynthesis